MLDWSPPTNLGQTASTQRLGSHRSWCSLSGLKTPHQFQLQGVVPANPMSPAKLLTAGIRALGNSSVWYLLTLSTSENAQGVSLEEHVLPQVCLRPSSCSDLRSNKGGRWLLFLVDCTGPCTSSPALWQSRTYHNTYSRKQLWEVNGVLIKTILHVQTVVI